MVDAGSKVGGKGPLFNLAAGDPNPGICRIDPTSGPVPFATGGVMRVTGEYFGATPQVYFWQTGASSTATEERLESSATTKVDDNTLTVMPPANVKPGRLWRTVLVIPVIKLAMPLVLKYGIA